MKRSTLFLVLAMLVIASLVLAACPSATPAPTEPPPAPVEQPTTPPEPTATPVPPTATPEPVATEAPTEEPTAAPTEEPMEEPAAAGEPIALTCEAPIKIGLITDLTGPLAPYGVMTNRSFQLGMEYASGAPGTAVDSTTTSYQFGDCEVQVLLRDDKGVAEQTATLARELIERDQVDFLVGTVSSGSTATLQEVAKESQVPLIVAPAAANDITGANFNEYTFRVSRNNYQDFINLCQYLTKEYDTFVQIAPDYSFGYGGAASARDACTKFGGEFVADDIFAPLDTTDFTPYVEQMLDSGAEAWIATWAGGGFVPLMQAAEDLGLTDAMAMGSSIANNATVPVFYATAVGQNSGILYHYTLPNNPINDWLVEQVKARYNDWPDLFDADGMNAALLAVKALEKSGGDTDAAALIETMEGIEFDGPKGKIFVRPEDHVAIQDMYIVKILNVDDPEFKFFELVDTTRPEPPCLLPEALQDRCGDLPIGSLGGQ